MLRSVLAVCASAVLGLSIAASGCDSTYDSGPENGGAKGPEIQRATEGLPPVSPSASSNSPGSPSAQDVFPSGPCDDGLPCGGVTGCMTACNPADGLFTACARCESGRYTACMDNPCQ